MIADVERVARIVCAILHGATDGYDVWDAIGEADRQKCRQIAAAAMAAIWPMFRERAVGVADDFGRRAEETLGSVTEGSLAKAAVMGNVAASRHIATAIRNLKDE